MPTNLAMPPNLANVHHLVFYNNRKRTAIRYAVVNGPDGSDNEEEEDFSNSEDDADFDPNKTDAGSEDDNTEDV
jgi:hypothetical protein